jgi:hypothetical protein
VANGRKANGHFAKGNQIAKGAGGGRPPKAREQRYHEIAMKSCTFKDWHAIMKTAVNQAKSGDKDARKFLADYLMGPPPKQLDITTGGEKIIWMVWDDADESDATETP